MPKPSNKGPKTTVTAIEGSPGSDVITPYEELNSSSAATTDVGDTVFGFGGDDVIDGGLGKDTIDGGEGDDIVLGGDGDDTINGGPGADLLLGETGSDTIDGGDGNDWIEGGSEDDVISGGLGDDTLFGGEGNDTINGGNDNDSLFGGGGDDFLFGDAGDDEFDIGYGDGSIDGSDAIDGGDGNDTVTYYGDYYTVEVVDENVGKGKGKTIEVTYVTDTRTWNADTLSYDDVDRIVNVETINFYSGIIFTLPDVAELDLYLQESTSTNVLANDIFFDATTLEYSDLNSPVITVTDIFIDKDENGVNDIIFDGTADYSQGVELSDGSFVQLADDGTLTFTVSDDGTYSAEDIIAIEYKVEVDGTAPTVETAIIDLKTSETTPAPADTLTLESMTFDTIGAYDTYLDGSYAVTQLTTLEFIIEGLDPIIIGVSELRDISAPVTESGDPDYDYDSSLLLGDEDDEEWRVWTEDGTPHEMNVTTIANMEALSVFGQDPADVIVLDSFKLTGFGEGEGLTVQYWNANGTEMLGFDYIDDLADLEDDGVTYLSKYDYENEPSVFQVTFSADDGTDVYIDDIVFV